MPFPSVHQRRESPLSVGFQNLCNAIHSPIYPSKLLTTVCVMRSRDQSRACTGRSQTHTSPPSLPPPNDWEVSCPEVPVRVHFQTSTWSLCGHKWADGSARGAGSSCRRLAEGSLGLARGQMAQRPPRLLKAFPLESRGL